MAFRDHYGKEWQVMADRNGYIFISNGAAVYYTSDVVWVNIDMNIRSVVIKLVFTHECYQNVAARRLYI